MRCSVPLIVRRIIEREPAPGSADRTAGLCASREAGTAVAATSAAPVPSINLRREIGFLGLLMGLLIGYRPKQRINDRTPSMLPQSNAGRKRGGVPVSDLNGIGVSLSQN